MSIRHQHSSIDASQNSRLSSTNSRWDMHTPFGLDKTPCSSLFSTALLIIPDRPLAQSKNRYGDKGSPCLIPLDGCIKPFSSPLIKIEYEVVLTISIANWTYFSSNPNFCITCLRNPHSTLSYALLISSFTAICTFFPLLLFRILCNISKATMVLSIISL